MKTPKGNPFTQRNTEKDGDPDIQEAKARGEESDPEGRDRNDATRPWNQKGASTSPWGPDILRISSKKEGMHLRWVREDNVERKLQEGYALAKGDAYGIKPNAQGRIQRRELVLMEIPEADVRNREANREALARQQSKDARRDVDRAAAESGVRVTEEE